MPLAEKSPLRTLVKEWCNCKKCPLHQFRKSVVMVRGKVPSVCCFVGEAPGQTENLFGSPFVGPAGDLLNTMIETAREEAGVDEFDKAFMNLVGCFPNDPERKTPEPKAKEIEACYPRLDALLTMCKPRLIVCVGKLATKKSDKENWSSKAKVIHIIHPNAVLISPEKNTLAYQRAILNLEDSFRLLFK